MLKPDEDEDDDLYGVEPGHPAACWDGQRASFSITQMSDDVRAERTEFTVNAPPAPSALSHPILQLTELAATLLMVLEKTKRVRRRRDSSICPPAPSGPFSSRAALSHSGAAWSHHNHLIVVSFGQKRHFSLSFVLYFSFFTDGWSDM